MNQVIQPAPVRKTVTVAAPPARAFDVFTRNLDAWWPKTHSIGKSPIARAMLEPREGGRWYEVGEDGSETNWGEVLVWDPPLRLVLGWRIRDWAYDPSVLTEVEVAFTPLADGRTRVDLEHRHLERLGESAARARMNFDAPNGWGRLLELFKDAAEAVRKDV
ncbi:MAG TPA: SRPBCC family protein [Caulobacteraceae bacterium]|nr:SRPBCC family protein [Caulobacteraceae bacterium]